ncbi:AAA family ATPase [Vibrio sp. E150_011]
MPPITSSDAQAAFSSLSHQLDQELIGQSHVVNALIIALITQGHILLEGLPGTAKTRAIKAFSRALNVDFGRIQFTPDLLPSDVTGTNIYREKGSELGLEFQPGPIFNNIVLADEINRAPAKVQAALLEAMAEQTVTIGSKTHPLPDVFLVMATQNPIEQDGTYPLPEAQMDRFELKVQVDYPDDQAELAIVRLVRSELSSTHEQPHHNDPTFDLNAVMIARQALPTLHASELVETYSVALVMATRHPTRYPNSSLSRWISIGASPRASIALDRCARAHAWLQGRDYIEPDDVRAVALPVLGHRISLTFDAIADGVKPSDVLNELLDHVLIG